MVIDMNIDLTGKTALVTGSTMGIGYATAAQLHASGATVAINGRDSKRVREAIDRLGGGDRLLGVTADLADPEAARSLLDDLPHVDVLVNNAGVASPQPVLEIPDEEWERLFAINVMSGVRLTRAYVPGMVERGWGRVVFVSSESALAIPPEMVHYGVTKLAQLGVARGFAEAVPGSGVTVNSVLPGPTATPAFEAFAQAMVEDTEASVAEINQLAVKQVRPTTLLGRPATADEVAAMIAYLCSPQASATTGTSVRVDGGVVRTVA